MRGSSQGSRSFLRRIARGASLLGFAALAAPAVASGDPVYVAPDDESAGFFCSQSQPCGVFIGVGLVAQDDDEVLMAPGTYDLGNTQLEVPPALTGVTIRPADPAAPRPVITSTASRTLFVQGANTTVRGIAVDHDNPGATGILMFGGRLQNVVSTSNGDTPCQTTSTRVRDTICHATATGGRAFRVSIGGGSASPIIRNATLVADGSAGTGIYASASGGGQVNIDVASSIVSGEGPTDIETDAAPGAPVNVTLAASNFASAVQDVGATVTVPGTGGNQTAVPIFTGPTLEQSPGSPTVDAGTVDAETGTTDVYGDARPQGTANDIGADELAVPPPPPVADTTPPETTITKKPKKKSKHRTARFAFAASEPGSTFECKVDKGAYAPCSQILKLKGLKRRAHKLEVRAIDAAGNVDATPATHKWKVKKKRR